MDINEKIELDKKYGLRALGLILYGALPSNLALLGALEIKIGRVNDLIPFLFIVSFLPIFLIYILIRDRHKEWYLTTDYLTRRSIITTSVILILATLISGVSGIIQNRYVIGIPANLNEFQAIIESFLFGVVSLIISTTFFMTVLTKETNLPGLPSADYVKVQTKIRNNLRQIKSSKIWKEYFPLKDNKLLNLAKCVEQYIDEAFSLTGNRLAKDSLKSLYEDVINFKRVLEKINESENETLNKINWGICFENSQNLSEDQKIRRQSNEKFFRSIENIKSLTLD